MKRKITGFLVDVENEEFEVLEIEDTLDSFYSILKCSCIDIVVRHVGTKNKRMFNIVCDDEGLFKDPQKISAIDNLGNPQLVGNIFITGYTDEEGNLTSLSPDSIEYIRRRICKIGTRNFPGGYPMLTQCEY